MHKKSPPVAALSICQQCSLEPKAKLRNGRKAANPDAQAFTRDVYNAVQSDATLASCLAVRATRCQGMCDHPVSFSFNSTKGEGWQWSGGKLHLDVASILAIARSYLQHVQTGLRVGKPEWPEGSGKWFMARIPAFPKTARWPRKPL